MIKYKEKQTLGGAWSLEVMSGWRLIGHIRKNASTGAYSYFDGPRNELTPAMEDWDLDALKRKVAARLGS
jgi:hypothetical protein